MWEKINQTSLENFSKNFWQTNIFHTKWGKQKVICWSNVAKQIEFRFHCLSGRWALKQFKEKWRISEVGRFFREENVKKTFSIFLGYTYEIVMFKSKNDKYFSNLFIRTEVSIDKTTNNSWIRILANFWVLFLNFPSLFPE